MEHALTIKCLRNCNGGTTSYQPALLVDIEAPEVSCYVAGITFDVLKDPNVFVFGQFWNKSTFYWRVPGPGKTESA